MGADLLVSALPVKAGLDDPDWENGRKYIRSLDSVTDLVQDHDLDMVWGLDETEELDKDQILSLTYDLEHAFAESREVTTIQIGLHKVYITGGMSWGDDPTDDYRLFDKFRSVKGLADACGFIP